MADQSQDLVDEIKLAVDASGVETGTARAKRSIEDLGNTVENVGKRGGEGLNRMGRDGTEAGQKLDQVTRNMVSSLQRQIAAAEAGGTATRQYQESIARLRGANMDVLRPYLDQLDAATAKTKEAERAVGDMAGTMRSLGSYLGGMAGGFAAYFSLRTFIDETIAAEQEQAQLAAVLRSTGEAAGWSREQLNEMAEAMSSKGGKSLFSAGEITQAQTRMLSYSNVVGEVFPRAMQNAINMAQRMGMDVKSASETVGKALDVPSEGLTALQRQGFRFSESQKALVERLEATGRTAEAQGIILAALESSYGGAAEAARNTFGGSLSALKNTINDLMTGEGGSVDSMRKGIEDLNGALGSPQTKEAFQNFLGWIATVSANAVTGAANLLAFVQASDKLAIVAGTDQYGKLKSQAEAYSHQLEQLTARAERYQEAISRKDNVAQNQRNLDRTLELIARVQRQAMDASQALKDFAGQAAGTVTTAPTGPKPSTTPQGGSGASTKKAAEELRKELAEQAKLIAELNGLSSSFQSDWERLNRMFVAGKLNVEQLTQAQADLLAKQPGIKAAIAEETKARESALKTAQQLADARNRENDGIDAFLRAQQAAAQQALESVQSRMQSLRDEEKALEIAATLNISLAEAVERVAIARLEEKQAGFYEGSEGWLAIQKEIDARRELLGLIGSKEAREANKRATDEAAKDWGRTAQTISDTLADYIMGGGRDAAQYLKRLFATLVLQPTVQTLVGGILGTGPAAAASGGSNILGTASNLGSLGAFGGTVSAGLSYGATSLFANGLGTTLAAGGQMIGAGSIVSGISTIAGALGPIALGVAALTSLISSLDDSGTPHAGAGAVYSGGKVTGGRDVYSYDRFDLADMNTYSAQVQGLVSPVAQSIGAALDAFATSFGQQAGYTVSTAFADDSSKDASWGALRIEDALGQVLVDWNRDRQSKWAPREFGDGEQGQKEYLAAIARDTRQVLLDMDLPSWADEILESIGDTADMDALTAAMTQIDKVQTSFEQLGASMQMFAGITDELQAALMGAAGGIDALVNSAGAFYQGFYTEAERMDALRGQLNTALSGLDLTIDPNMGDDAKAQFRRGVEDAMAAGDAELAASLLAISGNFATAADYFEQLSRDAAETAKKSAEDARKALIDSTYDMFRRLVDRDRDLLSSQASAISEVIGQISTSVDMLKSNARDLYGTVDSTAQMLAAQGMVYIEDALAGLRGGASITGYTGLQDAVTAARGGINSGVYVSQFERDRDALVLAGQLAEMAELGDVQLSVEERQLRAVNEQLEYLDTLSKRADDLVNGNTELTGTVQSNFDRLLALLDPKADVGDAAGKSSSAFAIGGSAPGGGGNGGAPYDKAAAVRHMVGLQLQIGADKGLGHDDPAVLAAINAGRYGTGITQEDIANAYGVDEDYIRALFASIGINRFAAGGAFTGGIVTRPAAFSMAQMGERGPEAIMPLANVGGRLGVYAMGGQGGNTGRLERLVEALTEQNARLEARLASIEAHAKKQADQFESYSNGGTYSRQKALA